MLKFMEIRFNLINEKEIKDLDKDMVHSFMEEAKDLFLKHYKGN